MKTDTLFCKWCPIESNNVVEGWPMSTGIRQCPHCDGPGVAEMTKIRADNHS